MQPHTAPPEHAWRLGQGPFIFSGVPPLCIGVLDLINELDQKVRVRSIPVSWLNDQASLNLGHAELRVGTRLLPHGRERARASFLVDPYTPPGTYTAGVCCGTQNEPVIVHVWEKLGLRVDPSEIRLRGAGGDIVTTNVVLINEGNVSETLRDHALVFLEERNWVGRSMVFALREMNAEDGHQVYLDRVVGEMKVSLARTARVKIHSDLVEIHPGQTCAVKLEITLPGELVKGRSYFGSTKFMSSKLIFKVECNGANNSKVRRPL